MTQFYSLFKTALVLSGILFTSQVIAQSPTTVTPSNNGCLVAQDFNTSNGGFTAPSIYSDQYDYEFNYSSANGNYASSPLAQTGPYQASLISPIYQNSAINGTANVGFSYTAPAGTLYRIRVIRPNVASGGVDILAQTSQGAPANWRPLSGTSGTVCLLLNDADIITGQNLRFEFVFYVPGTGSVTFDNFSLNSATAAPLPVTFLGIVAKREQNAVYLRWDITEEVNVEKYVVERSNDARTFVEAGSVASHFGKPVYSYNDNAAGTGTIYYRLKSVDRDGRTKLSAIIKLVNENSYSANLKVYPSPAKSQVTVQHKQLSAGAKVFVSTSDGRTVKTLVPASGASNTSVDISNLAPGLYIIKVDDGKGKFETINFVKQ